jgi:nucleoside-diphosphate-sugar epimerase
LNISGTKAILVTGGRGFIGRHLVRHLIASQGNLVVSVDSRPALQTNSNVRHADIELDVRDREALHQIFSRFEICTVFDLASITDVNLSKSEYASNLQMTKSVVDCVMRFNIERYIFYSSQFVFRKEGVLPKSDHDYYPIDDYGDSKIQSEQWIRANLPEDRWLILRPTYIWGEGHRRFRDGFLFRLAKGQMMLPTDRNILRYYGYVGTVCKQALALTAHPPKALPERTFYLSDQPISMRTFCQYFISALGKGQAWPMPGPVLRALGHIGDLAAKNGLSFPIRAVQANEITRNYPVPVETTLAITNTSTDYPRAAATVVAWALSDPEFNRRIGRRPVVPA